METDTPNMRCKYKDRYSFFFFKYCLFTNVYM